MDRHTFLFILLIASIFMSIIVSHEDDLIFSDLANHLSCKDLKSLMNNGTHLGERNIMNRLYNNRC